MTISLLGPQSWVAVQVDHALPLPVAGRIGALHDLPQRFAALAPIIRSDRALHYTPGAHGYTDYPRYEPAAETQEGEQIA